jgi:hypothetical protein
MAHVVSLAALVVLLVASVCAQTPALDCDGLSAAADKIAADCGSQLVNKCTVACQATLASFVANATLAECLQEADPQTLREIIDAHDEVKGRVDDLNQNCGSTFEQRCNTACQGRIVAILNTPAQLQCITTFNAAKVDEIREAYFTCSPAVSASVVIVAVASALVAVLM